MKRLHTLKMKTINPKRNIIKYKTLTTILRSFDTFVFIATTYSSITLSLTEISLIVIPISIDIACGLTVSIKVVYEIIIYSFNKYKKQYEKDQQTIKSFDQLYREALKDNVIDKSE